ncbi:MULTISPECIES: MBL fold metallo-hydrolase [Faecalibacterium]|uniref:MBL fold metallo-hydrolase n=1 Tax=Faecalibacterium TaxID=216851 RepID=UPI001F6083D1|nr:MULTISPECIES: MBL fold metallo-hydrolase [Faecalibacterium]
MAIQTVTDAIRYVGVDDNTLALFENQYSVQPMGVSYNSYVILDEKIAVMDSVDARAAEEWLSNVARVLEGRSPDYLVVTHMEPDHSGSLMRLAQKYPEMKIVGNAKTFTLIKQFFGTGALSEDRMLEVGERDTLATVYKGNIIKNLIMDCQSYTKYRPNETTGGIFVSWRRKEELPTGA